MRHATYESLEEDKTYYGEIPECVGVWANEYTLEACRAELQSTLEDWIVIHFRHGSMLPVVEGLGRDVDALEEA